MATIEERAKKQYPDCIVKYPSDDIPYNKSMQNRRLGYIKGATEQHQIDVDKACKWLDVTLSNIVNTMKEVLDAFPCIEPIHREEFINNFRNAMEG